MRATCRCATRKLYLSVGLPAGQRVVLRRRPFLWHRGIFHPGAVGGGRNDRVGGAGHARRRGVQSSYQSCKGREAAAERHPHERHHHRHRCRSATRERRLSAKLTFLANTSKCLRPGGATTLQRKMIVFLPPAGIALHNFPEGIAVFLASMKSQVRTPRRGDALLPRRTPSTA